MADCLVPIALQVTHSLGPTGVAGVSQQPARQTGGSGYGSGEPRCGGAGIGRTGWAFSISRKPSDKRIRCIAGFDRYCVAADERKKTPTTANSAPASHARKVRGGKKCGKTRDGASSWVAGREEGRRAVEQGWAGLTLQFPLITASGLPDEACRRASMYGAQRRQWRWMMHGMGWILACQGRWVG